MKATINRITGFDDAVCSLYVSKGNLTPEKEEEIRNTMSTWQKIVDDEYSVFDYPRAFEQGNEYMEKFCKYVRHHITLGRFLDMSVTVYGLHRGGQDDFDSHARRLDNRIIRYSSRLSQKSNGELSQWYMNKIMTTDMALEKLGIHKVEEFEYNGIRWISYPNGYVNSEYINDNDVKRGLNMLSMPSDFVFKCNLTEFAHIYKMRNKYSTAAPELKEMVESLAGQLEVKTGGHVRRELLLGIEN